MNWLWSFFFLFFSFIYSSGWSFT